MTTVDTSNEQELLFKVVRNEEDQYSIWPSYKEVPKGWREVGKSGTKPECLGYIKEVWTDLRPLSLRKKMETKDSLQEKSPGKSETSGPTLVERLCSGDHHIEASLRPEKSVKYLKDALERNYVVVRFSETRGGTELGIKLDRPACDLTRADFEEKTGSIHLEGDLSLNGIKVRCFADVSLETLTGRGRLALRQTESA